MGETLKCQSSENSFGYIVNRVWSQKSANGSHQISQVTLSPWHMSAFHRKLTALNLIFDIVLYASKCDAFTYSLRRLVRFLNTSPGGAVILFKCTKLKKSIHKQIKLLNIDQDRCLQLTRWNKLRFPHSRNYEWIHTLCCHSSYSVIRVHCIWFDSQGLEIPQVGESTVR